MSPNGRIRSSLYSGSIQLCGNLLASILMRLSSILYLRYLRDSEYVHPGSVPAERLHLVSRDLGLRFLSMALIVAMIRFELLDATAPSTILTKIHRDSMASTERTVHHTLNSNLRARSFP